MTENIDEKLIAEKLIFQPITSKKHLDKYLRAFFQVELTDGLVDPDSTTSPLEAAWLVYQAMATNEGTMHFVAAVSRNSGKTLIASVTTLLAMVIFRRNVVIMSAIKSQSQSMMKYLDSHLRKTPELSKYLESDNTLSKMIVGLPYNSYTHTKNEALAVIVAATMAGANSKRASLLVLDETDLTPPEIISEVAGVSDPTSDEHRFDPVMLALSSRKTDTGPLQEFIDKTETLPDMWKLLKWSVIDMLEPCKFKAALLLEEPKPAIISQITLEVIFGKQLTDIIESERGEWKQRHYYSKCKECMRGAGYLVCQGLTVYTKPEKSKLKRTLSFYVGQVEKVRDPAILIAQYFNWRPENKGKVLRMFKSITHSKTPAVTYREVMCMADDVMMPNLDNIKLMRLLKDLGWYISVGIDFGYSPDPAVAVFVCYDAERRIAIVSHVMKANFFSNQDWANYVMNFAEENKIQVSVWCPDTADASSPTYFKKRGYQNVKKKPMRISTGISQIRGLMMNPLSKIQQFYILEVSDIGYSFMIDEFKNYQHKRDIATGKWVDDEYEDKNNHSIDALRYALNPFHNVAEENILKTSHISISNDVIDCLGSPDMIKGMIAQQTGMNLTYDTDSYDSLDDDSSCIF